ncbi:hypothetical protein JCM10213_007503 [Rhodosporidiobolus nylandii]
MATSPPPPDSKSESFSYAEQPNLRFVAALPVLPEPSPPPADPASASLAASSSSSRSTAQMAAGAPPPLPPLAAAALAQSAQAQANSASALHSASAVATQQQQDSEERSQSRSRRRLTASLGSLIGTVVKKDKRRDEAGTASTTASRRSSSASRRRASIDESAPRTASPPTSNGVLPHPPLDPSTSHVSKPPVSLPSLFRRRNSSGTQPDGALPAVLSASSTLVRAAVDGGSGRASLDLHGRGASSSSSLGSSAVDGSPSLPSTAPTSPGTLPLASPEQIGELGPTVSRDEQRRRGSSALTRELSSEEGTGGEEDLADFVAASGASSLSPSSPVAPFAFSSSKPALTASPPLISSLPHTETAAAAAPVEPPAALPSRRLTRNIEGLSLSDLRTSPPLPNDAPPSSGAAAAPLSGVTGSSAAAESASSTPDSRTSSQRQRLGALPRLLSNAAISSYAANGEEEQEPDESETDTEAEGESPPSSSDDEGERYATGDEGPVTTRTPGGTPGVSPAPTPSSFPPTPRGRPSSSGGLSARTTRMPSLTGLSMTAAGAGPSNWVSFAPSTPASASTRTPSIRTARPQPGGDDAPMSYFDLPRPLASSQGPSGARSPLIPPQTPLAPMSISDVARGKRPSLAVAEEEVAARTPAVAQQTLEPSGQEEQDKAVRAGLYRMRSHSVVALASPSMVDSDDEPVGTAALTGLDPVWQTGVPAGSAPRTPGFGFLSLGGAAARVQATPPAPPPSAPPSAGPKTPAPLDSLLPPGSPASPASPTQGRRERPSTAGAHRLHRGRSMYELRDAPPAYSIMHARVGLKPQVIQPREEEGIEGLPAYTCAIHIEGYMPRKMEFTSPGVQAKDRAWKRQYVVLHGTSIKVYRFDLRTHPIAGEEDWSAVSAGIAGSDGPPPLHFHEGEYGVDPKEQQGAGHHVHLKFPLSIGDAKAKAKTRLMEGAAAAAQNQLVRHYSLQNAESGLAADYIKRKHVVRVRAEGEQFLLQAKDDRGVIDLIEALQAATNVALDLDARPLPKFITLPRRRRRRRPRPDGTAANGANSGANGANGATGAAGAAGATVAQGAGQAERRDEPDRMGDMLAEEQNAYSRRNSGTVM